MNRINILSFDKENRIVYFDSLQEKKCILNVYEEGNFLFSNEIHLIPNIQYYVTWYSSWRNKTIEFVFEDSVERHEILGILNDYPEEYFTMFVNKKSFKSRTDLCDLMDFHGSDKASGRHNYTKLYYQLFKDIRYNNLNVFELGLGTNNIDIVSNMGENGKPGASLRGWRDFFPNSKIYGADIDKRILFEEDRIKTFYCDQTKPNEIQKMWEKNQINDEFDIIIEDGVHSFDASIIFLDNSLYKLKKNGCFIIEDIFIDDLNTWYEYSKIFKKKYSNLEFEFFSIQYTNIVDNNIIVIKKK